MATFAEQYTEARSVWDGSLRKDRNRGGKFGKNQFQGQQNDGASGDKGKK